MEWADTCTFSHSVLKALSPTLVIKLVASYSLHLWYLRTQSWGLQLDFKQSTVKGVDFLCCLFALKSITILMIKWFTFAFSLLQKHQFSIILNGSKYSVLVFGTSGNWPTKSSHSPCSGSSGGNPQLQTAPPCQSSLWARPSWQPSWKSLWHEDPWAHWGGWPVCPSPSGRRASWKICGYTAAEVRGNGDDFGTWREVGVEWRRVPEQHWRPGVWWMGHWHTSSARVCNKVLQ